MLYCTHEPCAYCAKALINAGCERVVFMYPYPDSFARELLLEAGVEIVEFSADKLKYDMFIKYMGGM